MDFIVSDQDLGLLLDAYITRNELKEVWKKYLEDKKQEGSHKNIQLLGQKLILEKSIDPETIKSLFNPSKTPESPRKKWILETCKELPTVEQMDQLEGGEEIIEDIKKRLQFPEGTDPSYVGAVNSDHEPEVWCHTRDTDEEYTGYYHGMITCECHDNLPDRLDDLECDICKRKFKLENLHRFPHINGNGDGGWEGCFCSNNCMQETCHMNDIREEIMCAIYFG